MSVINREDAINYLMINMNWHDEDGYTVEDADEKRAIITDLINGVPDAEDGWIPCSERLPGEDDYKPCIECLDGAVWYFTENGTMGIGYYYESTKEWSTTNDLKTDGKVIAWKPLPPAFESKEDE